jgi:tetratricopeptide (TPR) repeat protein
MASMSTTAQTLALALDYHRAGSYQQAEQLYREILRTEPRHVDALQLLGLALYHLGQKDLAVEYLRTALRYKPDFAEVHNNLCNILTQQGKLDEAIAGYREAIRLKPGYADAHNNLGVALKDQGNLEEALACHREAIRLQPDFPEAHNSLGTVLKDLGRPEEAVACYRHAMKLRPSYVDPYDNMGILLMDEGKLEEAAGWCRQALSLNPNYPNAYYNLGVILMDMGRRAEALACYEQALRLKPDYAEVHFSRAMAWLLEGDFERGWAEYEWRWQWKPFKAPSLGRPLWDGSPLAGRTILLHPEQGLGDTMQFVRYAALVKQAGARVLFSCPPALQRLLSRTPQIDQILGLGPDFPPFDVHAPLLTLPRIFRTTLANLPANIPYIFADPELIEHWRQRLSQHGGFKIGIAWQGNRQNKTDRRRSIPLMQFARLAAVDGIRLFSLQKGEGIEQMREAAGRFPIIDLGGEIDEASGPFMDTAAVMKNMDLVISSDTATAHLAGALGVPVWLPLAFAPDWRWLLGREDSPWYPTMHLFRQRQAGNWYEVFERMADALAKRSGQWPVACSPRVDGSAEPVVSGQRPLARAEHGPPPTAHWPPATAHSADEAVMQNRQGIAFHNQDRLEEAMACYRQALRLQPENVDARSNLGVALQHQGRLDEALECYREALRLRPEHAIGYNNIGSVVQLQGKMEEAVRHYREALRLEPAYAEAQKNLGTALQNLGQAEEAIACYREAVRQQPNYAEAHKNLGNAYKDLGKVAKALTCYGDALRLQPDFAEAHAARALANLLAGNLAEAWPEYEWRWHCQAHGTPSLFAQPRWDGSSLHGRTILLFAEQGLGDVIQFIRYAPLVKARGGTVVFAAHRALGPLLKSAAGIDRLVIEGEELPPFDVQCALLSLPGVFRTTLATIPAQVPYLAADPGLTEQWRRELASIPGFKIGIAWQGAPGFPSDRLRSIPLRHFTALARVGGARFFSLQKQHGLEQIPELAGALPLVDLSNRLDETAGPFMDTAAVMRNLDLVITSDTAVAHLAGALAVPVWVILPFSADWRWFLNREDSPWYPTMRLFRQARAGDWDEVFQRVAQALGAKVAGH